MLAACGRRGRLVRAGRDRARKRRAGHSAQAWPPVNEVELLPNFSGSATAVCHAGDGFVPFSSTRVAESDIVLEQAPLTALPGERRLAVHHFIGRAVRQPHMVLQDRSHLLGIGRRTEDPRSAPTSCLIHVYPVSPRMDTRKCLSQSRCPAFWRLGICAAIIAILIFAHMRMHPYSMMNLSP